MIGERDPADTLRASLAGEVDARHRRLQNALGDDALLWLALPPVWTSELALSCDFPSETNITSVIDRTAAAHLTQQRAAPSRGGISHTFWVPQPQRHDLLSWSVDHGGRGYAQETAARIADRIARADEGGVSVPSATRTWVDLVRHARQPDTLVRDLEALVDEDRLAEASRLLVAAEALELLFDARWGVALVRCRRLVHVGYRRRHDLQALATFVPREEQIDPIVRLVSDPTTTTWALSMIGMGGVGKTMLLRYLSTGLLANEFGLDRFPVARADFDHIRPDYPVQSPVQLLLELVDELAPFASDDASDRALLSFISLATSAHAAASTGTGLASDDRMVTDAISAFAALVRTLPQPVVLVLDTCEELAKLHPAGVASPAVTRTFEILEQVRHGAPSVVVILAGRRYLASAGAGWTAPESAGRGVATLAARDYLRRVELRGFDADEARTFLRRPEPPLPDELIGAVLERSPEVGRVGNEHVTVADRYSPFDLDLYRRWFEVEPDLTGERLAEAGPDAYVEARIVARLHDRALTAALPAVALLGRVDAATLEPIARMVRRDVLDVVERLAEQEWVDVDVDPASGARVLAVDTQLVPRLYAWASSPANQAQLNDTRTRLAPVLRDRLRHAAFGDLGVHHVLGALRCAPAAAAATWIELEARVASEQQWPWMANVLGRVRGEIAEPVSEWTPDDLLRAAVEATAIASQAWAVGSSDQSAAWSEVIRLVAPLVAEDNLVATALARRARLGLHATRLRPATTVQIDDLAAAIVSDSPADAVAAAVEGMLDATGPGPMAPVGRALERWCEDDTHPAELPAAMAAAALRITAAEGRPTEPFARLAERLSVSAEATSRWPDWVGHEDLRAWVLLHVVRDAHVRAVAPHRLSLSKWELYGRRCIATIDGERLVSACLQVRSGWKVVDRRRLARLVELDRYVPDRRPRWAMHDSVPPLFVTLAEAYLDLGDARSALALVADRRQEARKTRLEDVTIRHAGAARFRIARRLRLSGFEASKTRQARTEALDLDEVRAAWELSALAEGISPAPSNAIELDPALWITWLRCQVDPVSVSPPAWLGGEPTTDPIVRWELLALSRELPDTAVVASQIERFALAGPPVGPDLADARLPAIGPQVAAMRRPVWSDGVVVDDDSGDDTGGVRAPPLDLARAVLAHAELTALHNPERAVVLFDLVEAAGQADPIVTFMSKTLTALARPEAGGTGLPIAVPWAMSDPEWEDWRERAELVWSGRRYEPGPGVSPEVTPRSPGGQPEVVPSSDAASAAPDVVAATLKAGAADRIGWSHIATGVGVLGAIVGVVTAAYSVFGPGALVALAAIVIVVVVATVVPPVTRRVLAGRLAAVPEPCLLAIQDPDKELDEVVVYARTPTRMTHGPVARVAAWIRERTSRVPIFRSLHLVIEGPIPALAGRLTEMVPTRRAAGRGRFRSGCVAAYPPLDRLEWEQALAGTLDPESGWRVVWWRSNYLTSRGRWLKDGGISIVGHSSTQLGIVDTYKLAPYNLGTAVRVLHLVGRSESTGTEVLFNTSPYDASGGGDARHLFAVDELFAASCYLAVVQGVPTTSSIGHRDAVEAASAVGFAVDLAAAGAANVLSIPALPLELTDAVVGQVAELARRRRRPKGRHLVRLAGRIKEEIVRAGDGGGWGGEARALANDVLLMLDERRA